MTHEPEHLVADIVAAAGGRLVSRIRLQKIAYLLDQLGAKSGQGFYTWSPERRERVLREKSAALGELAAWLNGKAGDS